MAKQPFDPRLKACMQELVDVLERYDVGAQIVLTSPTHSEYRTQFPTWSVAQHEVTEQGQHAIRFNTKCFTFPSQQGKRAVVERTVQMLAQFQHLAAMHFSQMQQILDMLSEHMEIRITLKMHTRTMRKARRLRESPKTVRAIGGANPPTPRGWLKAGGRLKGRA